MRSNKCAGAAAKTPKRQCQSSFDSPARGWDTNLQPTFQQQPIHIYEGSLFKLTLLHAQERLPGGPHVFIKEQNRGSTSSCRTVGAAILLRLCRPDRAFVWLERRTLICSFSDWVERHWRWKQTVRGPKQTIWAAETTGSLKLERSIKVSVSHEHLLIEQRISQSILTGAALGTDLSPFLYKEVWARTPAY